LFFKKLKQLLAQPYGKRLTVIVLLIIGLLLGIDYAECTEGPEGPEAPTTTWNWIREHKVEILLVAGSGLLLFLLWYYSGGSGDGGGAGGAGAGTAAGTAAETVATAAATAAETCSSRPPSQLIGRLVNSIPMESYNYAKAIHNMYIPKIIIEYASYEFTQNFYFILMEYPLTEWIPLDGNKVLLLDITQEMGDEMSDETQHLIINAFEKYLDRIGY